MLACVSVTRPRQTLRRSGAPLVVLAVLALLGACDPRDAVTTNDSDGGVSPSPAPPSEPHRTEADAAMPAPVPSTPMLDAGADAERADADAAQGFDGAQRPLPADLRSRMTGSSWRPGCPVALDDLALLELPYWDFQGARRDGRMVVAASVAANVVDVFRQLYEQHFPIAMMQLVDEYGANDDLSMADDNTSAFNCRRITGGSAWSAHSYGTAIDINPRENPYVRGQTVLPPEGAQYLDRTDVRPGMATEGSPLVMAFDALDWGWGGRWTSPKDYQHFSVDNR